MQQQYNLQQPRGHILARAPETVELGNVSATHRTKQTVERVFHEYRAGRPAQILKAYLPKQQEFRRWCDAAGYVGDAA